MARTKQTIRECSGCKYPRAVKNGKWKCSKKKKRSNGNGSVNTNCPKKQLFRLLSMLGDSTQAFSTDGTIKRSPLPGLHVDGVGPIALPLNKNTAKEIINVAKQTAFHSNEKQIDKDDMKKCWEIPQNKILIENSVFHSVMKDIIMKVKHELGYGNRIIDTNLHKLVLYEEGVNFSPCIENDGEEGILATLIVQLPSYFKGNKLIISRNGSNKEVEFDKKDSENEIIYAAFCTDCQCVFTPLVLGYRICLVYNLILNDPLISPKFTKEKTQRDIADLLLRSHLESKCFGFSLEYEYSENDLKNGIDALKGKEKEFAQCLQEANKLLEEDKKFNFFIAKLECELIESGEHICNRNGECDMEFDSYGFDDESTNIVKAYNFEGVNVPVKNMSFDIAEDLVDLEEKYDGDIEEFWGEYDKQEIQGPNEDDESTRTRWYSKHIIVAFRDDQ